MKAAPVEYVKVCPTYGPGFFYIPGTQTCIRVYGNARFEANVAQTYARVNNGATSYRSGGRIGLDVRDMTEYGLLRTVAQVDLQYRTGDAAGISALGTGSAGRMGAGINGSGANRLNATMAVDPSVYVQLGGLTAGRLQSAFTFAGPAGGQAVGYAGVLGGDSPWMQNRISYTLAAGNGLTVTAGVEDPTQRRMGIATTYTEFSAAELTTTGRAGTNLTGATGSAADYTTNRAALAAYTTAAFTTTGNPNTSGFGAAGATAGNPATNAQGLDYNGNNVPDAVLALQLDQSWGQIKASAALHEIRDSNGALGTTWGYSGQLGAKVNLPMIAAGDSFYMQGTYADGASSYVWNGLTSNQPAGNNALGYGNVMATLSDAAVVVRGLGTAASPFSARLVTSKSWGLATALDHYWVPTVHSWIAASYSAINWDAGARNTSLLNGLQGYNGTFGGGVAAGTMVNNIDPASHVMVSVGPEWNPVKGLAIGTEVSYARLSLKDAAPGVFKDATGVTRDMSAADPNAGAKKTQDAWGARFRIKRDF